MKKLTFTIVLFSLFSIGFTNEAYQKTMTESIEKLFQAKTIPEYVEIGNQFERISNIEKTEWLPLYYATFAYIMISFQEPENAKKDQYLDQAQKYLDQALALEPNESELHMLQGFLYPSRITIDPMTRGMELMPKMNQSLDKALELNPDNPRVYYLRATMTFHMPEAYGGGAAKALPMFQLAEEKFGIFKPKTNISPNWGKEICDSELKNVQEILNK
jgi:tetratricopeptide (TPR) repeat protein